MSPQLQLRNGAPPRKSRSTDLIERLERRRMLAVFTGTGGNDAIAISASATSTTVIFNSGVPSTTTDTTIVINAGGGNDTFLINQSRAGTTLTLNGEAGDDSAGNVGFDVDTAFAASITFNGGADVDSFTSNNFSGANTATDYDIQADGIVKNQSTFQAHYGTIEKITFVDSDGDNRIGFSNINGATLHVAELVIDGRGGNDTISNTPVTSTATGSWKTSMPSTSATVNGGNGSGDVLLLSDSAGSGTHVLVQTSSVAITESLIGGQLDYQNFERMEIVSSSTADQVELDAKPAGMALVFDSNGGSDAVTIGERDLDSNGWSATTVTGGAGTDSILFSDDFDNGNQSTTYTIGNFSFAKGTAAVTYSAFEVQTINPADGALGSAAPNTINLNAVSSQISSTQIATSAFARTNIVNVGNGDLVNVAGAVTMNLGSGGTINFNDQSVTTARTYSLGASALTVLSRTINFGGAVSVNLNAGSAGDSISVTGVAAGAAVVAHGNGGNDTFNIGGGNFTNLAGNVSITGDANTDTVHYLDNSSTSNDSATLSASALLANGRTHSYSTVEAISIDMGSGGSTVSLNSVLLPVTVTGGAGDDVFNIGNGSLQTNFAANVVLDGGAAGNDAMNLLGQNDAAKNTYAFPTFNQFRFGDTSTGKFVTFSGLEQGILQCGSGDDTVDATIVTFALSIFGNAGNDGISVNQSSVAVTVDTGSEHASGTGFPAGDGLVVGFVSTFPATVVMEHTDTVIRLSVVGGSTLRIAAGAVLQRVAPFIDIGSGIGGTLDLTGGALLWRATSGTPPDFGALLTRGYNGGAWNGTNSDGAINSSLAAGVSPTDSLGYGLGSEIGISSIGDFSISAGDTVVRYTYGGDANLDGKINVDDYGRIDFNINLGTAGWTNGDFNYDGKINVDDYGIIDFNVGIQGPPLSPAAPSGETEVGTNGRASLPQPMPPLEPTGRDRDVFDSIFSTAGIL